MGKSPKEHTGEFKYNPQVTSCKDKGSKHRSKMPYIQFSIRQDRHKQEQSSNPPFMPVPQGETAATSSAWYSRDSQPLGNETSQNKEPRCLSGPAVAFGSKAPRFPSDGRGDDVGPATYKFESPIDKELRELKAKTKAFDAFSEPRLAPMKHGYYVVDNPYSGPGRYTPYEFENAHNRRFQGLFKVVPRNFDAQKYKVQSERNRALNVPPTDPDKCPAPVASSLKLR
nr:unnamed protein product [Spirometra erinaceieuropaei]